MKFKESGAFAYWEFSDQHVDTKNGQEAVLGQKRWGAMVVIKSFESAGTAILDALKDSTRHASAEGNIMHIALLSAENENNIRSANVYYVQCFFFPFCNSCVTV